MTDGVPQVKAPAWVHPHRQWLQAGHHPPDHTTDPHPTPDALFHTDHGEPRAPTPQELPGPSTSNQPRNHAPPASPP